MVEMLKTYDFRRQQPVFELEKIRFRDGAIFHDILTWLFRTSFIDGIAC